MLGYVTIGALDVERSGRFYDAVFAALGGERKTFEAGAIAYGPEGRSRRCLCRPAVRQAAGAAWQRHHDRVQGGLNGRGGCGPQGGTGEWWRR